jgi:catechol 2,3-dioxygenase-like lactoylglutathione lyase family enzyme
MTTIDHLILNVNDIPKSIDFYVNVLGFKHDGEDGPFTVIRVNDDFILLLGPWGTEGNEHYAFAMPRNDFDHVFEVIKEKSIPYGDSFHSVGNNTGPGNEHGAKGMAPSIYLFDPNHHLIEIRTYD